MSIETTLAAFASVWALIGGLALTAIAFATLAASRRKAREMRVRKQAAAEAQAEHESGVRFMIERLDHELRNPLMALQLSTSRLHPGQPLDGEDRRTIVEQVERLAQLVRALQRLQDIARAPIDVQPTAIDRVLEELVARLKTEHPDRSPDISLHIQSTPRRPSPALVDPELFDLVLSNLCSNALKYSSPGDRVEVDCREHLTEEGLMVLVQVSDSGIGIPESQRESVWGPFYRADNSEGRSGQGLGLALVDSASRRMGIRVETWSELGSGTRITLVLPRLLT